MLRDCPVCTRALPSGTRPTCPRCGLVWDEVGYSGWTFAAVDAPPSEGPLRIQRGPSSPVVGCIWLIMLPFAALAPALLAQIARGPALPHGALGLLGLAVVAVGGLGLSMLCLLVCVLAVLRRFAPESIEGSDEALRLRVSSGWVFRRTDVTLPREAITGAALRRRKRGVDAEVWLLHASGAALRITDALPREEAERIHAQLTAWLQPPTRARIEDDHAVAPERETEEDQEEAGDAPGARRTTDAQR